MDPFASWPVAIILVSLCVYVVVSFFRAFDE